LLICFHFDAHIASYSAIPKETGSIIILTFDAILLGICKSTGTAPSALRFLPDRRTIVHAVSASPSISQDFSELDQTLLLGYGRSVLRRRGEALLSVTCARSGSLWPVVLRLRLVQLGISALLLRLCWLLLRLLVVGLRVLALEWWLLLLGSFLRRVGC
jgi:hypothetical protein